MTLQPTLRLASTRLFAVSIAAALIATLGILGLPTSVRAQVEIGLDAGATVQTHEGQDNLVLIAIPAHSVRIGFPSGGLVTIETVLVYQSISEGSSSFSQLGVVPGVNIALGDGGAYARGEAGMLRTGGSGSSRSQFGIGGALGLKQAIAESDALVRLEVGYSKWLENSDDFLPGFNAFRLLVGVSAVVN